MAAHVIDSEFLKNVWGTSEMRNVFSDERRVARWLQIEAALAETQAELGIIPKEAAKDISMHASVEYIDIEFVRQSVESSGHTLVPVIKSLEKACSQNYGEYVHYGATTQDIHDTGAVLEIRDAYAIIIRDCLALEGHLLALSEKYKKFPMVGRTQCQQALPITLGFKIASWAAELRRDIERLKELPKRCFVIMLHGAVGTMAGFGEHAYAILEGTAKRLNLGVPSICWASARDTFAEYQAQLGILAGTLGRIGNEICTLSHTEIGELHEPLGQNYVGSSTMPHKRNTQKSAFTVTMSRIVQANALTGLNAMILEHERDTRSWRLDFHNISESSILIAKMLSNMNYVIKDLDVHEDKITSNLNLLGGMLLSEVVMFELGKHIGKQTAHKLVKQAAFSKSTGSFQEHLLEIPEVAAIFSADDLVKLFDYSKYIGHAAEEVDHVISYCRACHLTDPVS